MKKLLYVLFIAIGVFSLRVDAQVQTVNGKVTYVLVAPSGSCSTNSQMQVVLGAGTVWTCQTGTWAQVAGGGGGLTSVGLTANGGATCGDLTIGNSPLTTNGTLTLTFAGTNGDVWTFNASGCPQDSGTLLSALLTTTAAASTYAPLASPTFTGTVTIPTGASISGFAPLASPTFTGTLGAAATTLTGLLTTVVGTSTNPSVQATGSASNTGIVLTTTNMGWDAAGTVLAAFTASGVSVADSKSWIFSSSASGTGSPGASMSVVGSGTGTGESMTPSSLMLMPVCKVTSAVNMTSSGTPVTICSFSLPSSSQNWGWQCNGTYTTSTASDTFSLGYTASQAPSQVNGNAIIYSTLTGTSTAGSTSSTTSTSNQTMLTGASVSSVTTEPFQTNGVIITSASAGTFVITGSLTGSSPSGSVNPGTVCTFF